MLIIREFKMNDLTRTISAWNLPDRVTMNDFSSEKKFLLNSSKEWRMRMRGILSAYMLLFEQKAVVCQMNYLSECLGLDTPCFANCNISWPDCPTLFICSCILPNILSNNFLVHTCWGKQT